MNDGLNDWPLPSGLSTVVTLISPIANDFKLKAIVPKHYKEVDTPKYVTPMSAM